MSIRFFIKKRSITCHSEVQMNQMADSLIYQGYKVEREVVLQSLSGIYEPVYRLTFWK